MTDPVDGFVEEIQAELCRFMRCGNAKLEAGVVAKISSNNATTKSITYSVGGADASSHKPLPSISWIEGGGKVDASRTNIGDDQLFSDVVRLAVMVQAPSKEACRKLWMNLRNAASRVCNTQIVWTDYTEPCEEKPSQLNAHGSWAIAANADLTLPVRKKPQHVPGFPEPLEEHGLRQVIAVADSTVSHN